MQTVVSIKLYLCILIELNFLYVSFINLWEDTYETVTCAIRSFRPVFIRNISYISDHPTPLVRFGRQKPLSPKKSFFKARNSSSIIENEFGDYWRGGVSLSTSGLVIGIIFFVITATQFIPTKWIFVRDDWQNPNNGDDKIIIVQ